MKVKVQKGKSPKPKSDVKSNKQLSEKVKNASTMSENITSLSSGKIRDLGIGNTIKIEQPKQEIKKKKLRK